MFELYGIIKIAVSVTLTSMNLGNRNAKLASLKFKSKKQSKVNSLMMSPTHSNFDNSNAGDFEGSLGKFYSNLEV